MKYPEKEKEPSKVNESDWDEDERLCPECEGRGFTPNHKTGEQDLCMTCDGLGVIYEKW